MTYVFSGTLNLTQLLNYSRNHSSEMTSATVAVQVYAFLHHSLMCIYAVWHRRGATDGQITTTLADAICTIGRL